MARVAPSAYDAGMDIAGTLLTRSGLRITPERTLLLKALAKAKSPLSSKELHEKVAGAMDRVTVYRNLESFAAAGIIRKVDVGHRHAHYEVLGDTEHHHLICTACGRVEDISYCPDPQTMQRIISSSKHFSHIERHALEFYGRCKTCVKKS